MISLKQFINDTKGKVVGFTDTKNLKGECVTLIQEYIRLCYDIPFKARGHAKSWINTCNDIATKTTKPQYGDIIVWDGTYGHLAIYIDGKKYYDQYKGRVANYATNSVSSNRKILGYLRLNGSRKPDVVDVKFNLTRLLKNGSRGNDVKELQKSLGGLVIDGIFGAKTKAKVIAYQKSKKLYQDGLVGKNTAHALGWLYNGQ